MQPEVIAGVTNTVGYANANPSSSPFVDAEVRDDPAVYPDAEVRAQAAPVARAFAGVQREVNRAWTRVKTGQ